MLRKDSGAFLFTLSKMKIFVTCPDKIEVLYLTLQVTPPLAGQYLISKFPLLTIILILFFQNIFAQKLPFRNYSIKDGLAQSSVNDIYQDSKGYLWFATQSGVSKFDGMNFKTYTTEDGLPYNHIKCITGDHEGNIWFGTQRGGISKFNGKTFENYTAEQGLIDNAVRAILEDQNGFLWVGTDGGISILALYGTDHTFNNFTTDHGLNDNSVRALLEDSNGNIWIGTDRGVCRSAFRDVKDGGEAPLTAPLNPPEGGTLPSPFPLGNGGGKSPLRGDLGGLFFENFSNQPGYNYIGTIWSILEDHDGNIWFGSHGSGITKFEPKAQNDNNFTHYSTTDGLTNNVVRCIVEDQYGNRWFGTNQGLSKIISGYNKGPQESPTFENFTTRHGLIDDNIRSILEDNNGNIWIGTDDGGVTIFGGRYFEQYSTQQGLVDNTIFCINEDQHGNIWIGTDAGLSKLVINNTLQRSTAGKISLFEHHQTGFQTITIEVLGGDKGIMSMLEDKNGNIWIGTHHDGISKLIPNPHANWDEESGAGQQFYYRIQNYNTELGINSEPVNALLEDRHGNIWFGTDGGVTKLAYKNIEQGAYSPLHPEQALLNNPEYSGSQGKPLKNFTTQDGLIHNEVLTIYEDRYGNIWVGTRGGLSEFIFNESKEPSYTIKNFTTEQGLAYNYVWPILEDRYGNLWFGTKGGLSKLIPPPTSPTTSPPKSPQRGDFPPQLPKGKGDGKVPPLGGFRGAGDLEEAASSFKNYTKKDGLKSNAIWLMTMDNEGNIWVGHEKGIEKLIQNDSGETVGFQYYGYLEGFTPMETNANAVFKDSKGNLWFGTLEGAVKYDPKEDRVSITVPRTHITNIRLFGTETDFSVWCDSLDRKNGLPKNLRLPYDKNHLSFDYIGIHYKIPEKIKYQYKLEGFDKKWSEFTSVTFATYTNLESGNYTFKVKACNSDGFWNLNPTRFSFIISPPFWKTGWYYASEILFFTVLIAITFYINKTKTKSRVGTILTFATILFIFEFLNISIEPYVEDYAGGVPIFKLIMNMTLAGSLNPLERLISRFDEYI
ncbi:MAG: hypothetical protein FVQ77_14345 [Cytophagales bacterium]|nr:hypothetical protein [Cytophagales bacterium]